MNHFEAGGTASNLAETADVHTGLELRLLLSREVEKAQRELAAAIADAYEQVTASAKRDFGQEDFARDETARTGLQRTDPDELRAILVAQGQQEQQVFDAKEPKFLELLLKQLLSNMSS